MDIGLLMETPRQLEEVGGGEGWRDVWVAYVCNNMHNRHHMHMTMYSASVCEGGGVVCVCRV